MFKKTALVAGVGLALSVTAHADYQWELGGDYSYGQLKADVKNNAFVGNRSKDIDENIGEVHGTWYMEPVDTSKGPLNEAPFLDHSSNITLFGRDGEVDLNSVNRNLQDKNGHSYGIDSRYVAEGPGWKLSGWLMDLGYEYAEPGDRNINLYTVGLGKYLTPTTTLVAHFNKATVNNGGDTDGYDVGIDHFFAFSHGGLKVDASGGKVVVNNANDVNLYKVGGTWYLNNNLGFGADYHKADQDGREVDGFGVNANWFVTQAFAVDLSYGQDNFDDIKFDAANGGGKLELSRDVAKLGAKYQF
jgi:hypothetical protein